MSLLECSLFRKLFLGEKSWKRSAFWEDLAGRGPSIWKKVGTPESISEALLPRQWQHLHLVKTQQQNRTPLKLPSRGFLLCILFLNPIHFLVISEGFGKWWKCRGRKWRRGSIFKGSSSSLYASQESNTGWGKNHPQGLKKTAPNTHSELGIVPVPPRHTGKAQNTLDTE